MARLSVLLPRDLPADRVLDLARAADDLGFDALWVVEDLGFRGGVAQAAAVLGATSRLQVGIGILPVGARSLPFAAMEVATLAQLHPGRLVLGVGHGMPGWMRAAGAWPASPLGALDDYLVGLRALLRGETTAAGLRLEPGCVPEVVPPLLAGVRGPRSLALAGRLADGTVLAEPVTPEYVARVREQLGDAPDHRLVAYHLACVRDDLDEAVAVVRPALAVVGEPDWAPHVDPLPWVDDLRELRRRTGSADAFAEALPTAWLEQLAVVGPPDRARERLRAVAVAGVHEHVLVPLGLDPVAEVEALVRLR
ncbi:LLM class flavin-dependent oxidoreductase [Nocardioides marmoraquaticus]